MTHMDQLLERGEKVYLNVSLHPLKLASMNPAAEWLSDFLDDLLSGVAVDDLVACGMPLQGVESATEDEDGDEGCIADALQAIGGWLVIASVPGSKRFGSGNVMMRRWVGTSSVFWGQTQEAALKHAVKWGEELWGNDA